MANLECKQVAGILPPRAWHRMKCRRRTQSRELPNMETEDYNLIGISAGPGGVVCSESRRLERKIEINSDTRRHASVTSRGQHSYKEWSMRACSDSLWQPKLLRVLQEQEFERLGSTRTVAVNVRVVAATSRNLPQMVQDRQFRSDLYYRLNVFPIRLP